VVRVNEILTEVVIPAPMPDARSSFEKLRPRGVWDFAMAALALNLQVRNAVVQDARVVFGGIAGRPVRERTVEDFLKGKSLTNDVIAQAVERSLANAAPLKYNAMKIEMAKGLLASGLEKVRT
jgi:xanthine dehydrogenase YagS FAD-binding subunit